ncbi:hypothetical protein BK816_07585 [Boudabousia tangfeifanii]|uniref:Haloacid dehalogenase n=1 Tax=Boudabousia tangfeifanii TaxID=1912795 RepID=A0A1D9MLJ9_9ACTO|nr:HAD-IB family hydrolase [Boudabousia tangfeifanii]AOZ73172.1 hypothetical protein BK816_07585 [Boudabousia tangfeifanii]
MSEPEKLNDQDLPIPDPDGPQVAAFFDIDETLIRGASAFHVAKELYKRNFFGKRDIAFAAWHSFLYRLLGEDRKRIDRVINRALNVMAGHSAAELDEIGANLYEKIFSHRVFPGTKEILQKHLDQGHEVWLISATPVQVSNLLAEKMGATGALGTVVKIDEQGRFLPELDGQIMHLKGKAQAAVRLSKKRGLNLPESYAYGDSINDLPLLQTVGHPSAINPEPLLRIVALEKDWPIHNFRKRRLDIKAIAKRGLQSAAGALLVRQLIRHYTTRH